MGGGRYLVSELAAAVFLEVFLNVAYTCVTRYVSDEQAHVGFCLDL